MGFLPYIFSWHYYCSKQRRNLEMDWIFYNGLALLSRGLVTVICVFVVVVVII